PRALAVFGRRRLVAQRRIRLAHAVLGRVRRRAVVAQGSLHASGGIDHRDAHLLPVRAALLERGVERLERGVGGNGRLVGDLRDRRRGGKGEEDQGSFHRDFPSRTRRTPPFGSGRSPEYRGIKWTCTCMRFCPAAFPTLTPML